MAEDSLNDKRSRILLLEKEINEISEEIKKKKEQAGKKNRQLDILKLKLYKEYFSTKREEFALLTDIPSNPEKKNRHVLFDYSCLNVDMVGKIICDLIKRYDNEDFTSKRGVQDCTDASDTYFLPHHFEKPVLVIAQGNEVNYPYKAKGDNKIIIEYSDSMILRGCPTNIPVTWKKGMGSVELTDYAYLIYNDGVVFSYPNNKEYIKELIYSLAYYQKEHDVKYMTPEDTWNVYQKIYKK
jgi:hypothetical protein